MSHGYQRGFIGTEEIELAITELKSLSYKKDENLFVNVKMNGKNISIHWYGDLEELLGENEYLEQYYNLDEYIEKMKEIEEDYDKELDCDFKDFSEIFKKNEIAYIARCGDSGRRYIDNEKEYPIRQIVSADIGCSFYSYEEAMANLKGDFKYLDEDLVIGLLS